MWWKLGDVGSRDDMDEVITEASKSGSGDDRSGKKEVMTPSEYGHNFR